MHKKDAIARFDDYIDGQMPELEKRAFEEAVASDPLLRDELSDYSQAVKLVREIPLAAPPPGFYQKVRGRIMRRVKLRYQEYNYGAGIIFEATVCAVLIAILAALYLYVAATTPIPSNTPSNQIDRVRLNHDDRQLLGKWGEIRIVGTSIVGSDLEVSMNLMSSQEKGLRDALRANGKLFLVETSVFRKGNYVRLKVRAPPGPIATQGIFSP